MKYLLIIMIVIASTSYAEEITKGSNYVVSKSLNVRLGPKMSAKKTNTLYYQQKVEVHEVKNGWARISKYYDGLIEGEHKTIARWVSAKYLSGKKPQISHYKIIGDSLKAYRHPRVDTGKYGVSTVFYFNSKIKVLETRDGWARVSRSSNSSSKDENWVPLDQIKEVKDELILTKVELTPLERAINKSDDYDKYKYAFVKASDSLVKEKKCTIHGLKDEGGWMKSFSHKPKPVYFTYCVGSHRRNRIYLNVSTGEIFK